MSKSKPYLFAVVLGVIVFLLLKLGCSTEPKIIKVEKPYQLKFDSTYFNDRLDSLAEVICHLKAKKSPLFQRQKDERKRADSVISNIQETKSCDQVDTLVDLLYKERKNCDSIIELYKKDSLVNIELVSTLRARGDSAFKELKEIVPKLDSSRADNFKLKLENSKLKKQRNTGYGVAALGWLLNLLR